MSTLGWQRMNTSEALKKSGADGSAKDIYIDYGPQLSDAYGATAIDALAVDPEKIFVYWEFSADIPTGNHPAVMLESLDDDRASFADAGYPTGQRFFAAQPDRRYRAAIGFSADGRFTAIAVSDVITTPRRGPSMEIDPEWRPSREELAILKKYMAGGLPPRLSSSSIGPGAAKKG